MHPSEWSGSHQRPRRPRRQDHDLPAIGTPEHTALLSGALDLAEIQSADPERHPLVGFAPIVLDPAGLPEQDVVVSAALPDGRSPSTRRSLRAPSGSLPLPPQRPLPSPPPPSEPPQHDQRHEPAVAQPAEFFGPRPFGSVATSVPTPRRGLPLSPDPRRPHSPRASNPWMTSPRTTAALRVDDVRQALAAAAPALPIIEDDPTPTGELARPFVGEPSETQGLDLDQVPPPVSVDVFQQAVRAGLAPEDVAVVLAPDAGPAGVGLASPLSLSDALPPSLSSPPSRPVRSRRELRARERAARSPRAQLGRRLAKGGVLAITALGVVSSASPQALSSLGLDPEVRAPGTNSLALGLILDPTVGPTRSPQQEALKQRQELAATLQQQMATAEAASHAGLGAGGAVLDWAKQRDAEADAKRREALARAARDAVRDPRGAAQVLVADRGWSQAEFECLDSLWNRESRWDYRATNPSSGAYGIAQALPGSKMSSAGDDWQTNPVTQIKWGLNYISERYSTPCGAWSHSEAYGWY